MSDWTNSKYLSIGLGYETLEFLKLFRNNQISIDVPISLISAVLNMFTYGVAPKGDENNNVNLDSLILNTQKYMYDDELFMSYISDEVDEALKMIIREKKRMAFIYLLEAIRQSSFSYLKDLKDYWESLYFIPDGIMIDGDMYFSTHCYYDISPFDTIIIQRIAD